ncbi:M20/M25/M40 family metallo-hydrolase [Sphingomonas qomolangmaensis]|uniref:Carboxypeptidase Q n=1 Tax=Sphingomonas qomolangmaensis TaxID=2918765 RepID=A0ABY5L839_9SPHN|nr:M20/M25/M40 family metallo-hydrolase [Sphingomonas qomolangmaensis]UUL82326.1 M20/M25/M40 family metallo-hydrolase [Sphingomonas qomolangmaensis]
MRLIHLLATAALVATPIAAGAQTTPPPAPEFARVVDEGTNRSQVMVLAQHMTDVIGPRLTNSPQMRTAEAWALAKFRDFGLSNVRKEGFDFGRGWSINASSVRMVTPRPIQLTAIPIAWTPPTNGTLSAPIIVAPMSKSRHFAAWRGKLAGKIVLVTAPGKVEDATEPGFKRLTGEDIAKLDSYREPSYDPAAQARRNAAATFEEELDAFLKAEGAVGFATMSYRDNKLLHGEGYMHKAGASPSLPGVQIAAEDYRRLARLATMGPAPTLEIMSDVAYDDSDTQAYNILADLPGTDPRAGYVMAGAHYDSWVAGDGATDNAAGSAMIMEAARILKAMGVRPKRTIRFALWNGEEQALYGSINYIERYLARRPAPATPENSTQNYYNQTTRYPVTPLPGYRDLAAYFNIDNGSGKLRGIHAENNAAAVPILREWLSPFAPMGSGSVVFGRTAGTDHQFMAAIGLPAFQFIQDPLDYSSITHHSGADTFDHLKAADMRQGAMVLAWMLLQAANADTPLPRNPIPNQPVVTDPFATPDPNAE